MTFIFQLIVLAFIATSFLLVVGVPYVFALKTTQWEENKKILYSGISIWLVLVFTVGIFNSFII